MRVVVAESVAMFAIGDGVLGVLFPVQHSTRWDLGPKPWGAYMRWFADHPGITRTLSAAQIAAGVACAARLPSTPR
ncbi:hypothetical protein [Arthrobacter sp. TE12232]